MIKVSSYTITSPALPPLPLFILISMSLSLTESTSDCSTTVEQLKDNLQGHVMKRNVNLCGMSSHR